MTKKTIKYLIYRDYPTVVMETQKITTFVEVFESTIDEELRARGENNFFGKVFGSYSSSSIIDVGAGTGYDITNLAKQGFKVTANEIEPELKAIAVQKAENGGVKISFTEGHKWGSLAKNLQQKFDGVLCIGNALTYLFKEEEQVAALRDFRELLNAGKPLIIDQRNYDYMLGEREHILKDPKNNFRFSGKYYYCGPVKAYPTIIKDNFIRLEYFHPEASVRPHLDLYPLRRQELVDLLYKAGFSEVESFSDFQKGFNPEADFFQHVAVA